MKTIYWADFDTVSIFAAYTFFSNNKGHIPSRSFSNGSLPEVIDSCLGKIVVGRHIEGVYLCKVWYYNENDRRLVL